MHLVYRIFFVVLQLLFSKYKEPFYFLYICQTIYLLIWQNFHVILMQQFRDLKNTLKIVETYYND